MDVEALLAESGTKTSKSSKKPKERPNPLFSNPLSPLSLDICARFPPELHDYIIDHLHDDRRTLSICTLVCRAWHAPSTYQLFMHAGTIHVDCHNLFRFCELLATQRLNPYIGRLVLESHVIDEQFEGGPTFQFNEHLQHFTGLPHLWYLRLHYHHDDVFPSFLAAVAQNFTSVTALELSSFHFDSFSQSLDLCAVLPLLRRLALVDVVWYDQDSADSDSDKDVAPPSYGESGKLVEAVVDCRYMTAVLRWLPFNPCIRRLQIGKLRNTADVPLLSNILRKLGPCLEHLVIYDYDNMYPLDFSSTTTLRTLEITGIRCTSLRDLTWLPALLSDLRSRSLERITFVLVLPERAGLDLFDWPRISALLAGLDLKRVEFSLSGHRKWAVKTITEKLGPKTYALKVGQWERGYQYALSRSDV
ncbi:hypothetical protein DFH07DRAFT_59596 [Mycena maculata]|uniref:F-box domain-containing protein n=1 Tax=Mycena maculata TaxID=230809 RepID=A0AAD7IGL6_9AGAR|nr:hypothetical protein DFH07DRAFT_59596 [Mycena maculata]